MLETADMGNGEKTRTYGELLDLIPNPYGQEIQTAAMKGYTLVMMEWIARYGEWKAEQNLAS